MEHQQDDPYQQSRRPAQQDSSQWPLYASQAPRARGNVNNPNVQYDDQPALHNPNMYNPQQPPTYGQPPPNAYDPNAILYNQAPPIHHQQRQFPPPCPHMPAQGNAYASLHAQPPFYSNQPSINYAPGVPPMVVQHPPMQQQQQQVAATVYPPAMAYNPMIAVPVPKQAPLGRPSAERPVVKLSVALIDTYKHINTIYYEERDARRALRAKEKKEQGSSGANAAGASTATTNNNGWDDENYDYIFTPGELFFGRYKIMERIGKGSFGQVVRAEDTETKREVAIKIIKSKKPFLLQAKTEIELLTVLFEKDPDDQHNLGTFETSDRDRVRLCVEASSGRLFVVCSSHLLLSCPACSPPLDPLYVS